MEPLTHEEGAETLRVDGRAIELPGALRDAWRHEGWILVMCEVVDDDRLRLLVYDAEDLEERHRVPPPEGWDFDRLSRDITGSPTAIAWTAEAIDGHHDWQFRLDPEAGTLTRTHASR